MSPLAPVEVIERRRRGEPIDAESVSAFMRAWLDGVAGDAQMAAWCMAAGLEPARLEEVDALARALVASGDRLDLEGFGPTGDCQSTGAIGDSATLAALPLAASLGVVVASIGASSVGLVGGMVDRLAAIPGMRSDLSLAAFAECLGRCGCAVVAPAARRVSAAPRFDALRDATATGGGVAPSIATLMARTIAVGAGSLALLVPAGRAGAVADAAEAEVARDLATLIAAPWGRRVHAVLADADHLSGRCVGAGPEVAEAGAVLRGEGPAAVRELAIALAAGMAEAAGVVDEGDAASAAARALADGDALAAAERWVEAQGGDAAVWTDATRLPAPRARIEVAATRSGRVIDLDPLALGEAARWAGAGRLHAAQVLDPAAGIEVLVDVGDDIEAGQPLLAVRASDAWLTERAREIAAAGVVIDDAEGGADA